MSAEEPETEAGAANDATEVVDDDFSTRLRSVGGGQAETQEAWSDDDDAADDVEPEGQPWSVVTGHAAALLSVGAAVAAAIAVLGWMMLHKDRPAPFPCGGEEHVACGSTSVTAAADCDADCFGSATTSAGHNDISRARIGSERRRSPPTAHSKIG